MKNDETCPPLVRRGGWWMINKIMNDKKKFYNLIPIIGIKLISFFP